MRLQDREVHGRLRRNGDRGYKGCVPWGVHLLLPFPCGTDMGAPYEVMLQGKRIQVVAASRCSNCIINASLWSSINRLKIRKKCDLCWMEFALQGQMNNWCLHGKLSKRTFLVPKVSSSSSRQNGWQPRRKLNGLLLPGRQVQLDVAIEILDSPTHSYPRLHLLSNRTINTSTRTTW